MVAMYLCCPFCCLRLRDDGAAVSACPTCDRALERTNAHAALGYRLFQLTDPLPLSPTAAAVAAALSAMRPGT